MMYNITATQISEYEWQVRVAVFDDVEVEILSGETFVCVETEAEALEYGERVFLPDLRVNFPRVIGGLVLNYEVSQEEGGAIDTD